MNMMPLHKRRNTERTAITTLKFVVLWQVSHYMSHSLVVGGSEQLTPYQWRTDRFVVCVCVNHLVWVAIPSMIRAFLPESGAIKVWLSNAKESESSDAERKLKDEEAYEDFWCAPFSRNGGEAR